ncbi:hypothetical protein NPX13_g10776 [Xylaria arbuscula]|uniref:Uncharacterized protein n=1 Tax=Xylaria arbuscula TaxID=114810 RepID=A0A9W8N454_9PEZI|nr:hypothetical protein NPX13_g10776 [Xylaria arbuscula]
MQVDGEDDKPHLRMLLSQYPMRTRIFGELDTKSILNLCRTSPGLRADIYSYRWDISRRLERFFQNPTVFRSALGQADALITGSFALQFFTNKFWPESDLDINVQDGPGVVILGKFLEAEGYELIGNRGEPFSDYEEVIVRLKHIRRILTFIKPQDISNDSSLELKVQLIVTCEQPVLAILGSYYTSCVVNFITWNKAYCIFPRATLLFDEMVTLTTHSDYNVPLYNKYSKRGWRLRTRPINLADTAENCSPRDIYPLGSCLNSDRRIDDFRVQILITLFQSNSLRYQYTYGRFAPFWLAVADVLVANTHGQLKTKMKKSEAEQLASDYQGAIHRARFEKPDGWDYWDDWIPETFDNLQQRIESGS